MEKEEEVILTARYLIEDNANEYLLYDENTKNDLHIVRSILKKLLGTLPPWDEHKNFKLNDEISDIKILVKH